MNARNLRIDMRLARWASWVLGAALTSLVLVLLIWLVAERNRPPPVHYTKASYAAEFPTYCPGQTVKYQSQLIVTRVPATVMIVRTLWDIGENQALTTEPNPSWYVWTADLRDVPVLRNVNFYLPKGLPDGQYEIRVGASTLSSESSTYRVAFAVSDKCAGGK